MAGKKIVFLLVPFSIFLLSGLAYIQNDPVQTKLWETLKQRDSLMFEVGFNTCDVSIFEELVSDNLEFYHDQSGIVNSKEQFLKGTREGLCALDYQPIRVLDKSSLKVFPMKNNGELYGGIQTGHHFFYAKYPDREELVLTSEADFSHLWLLEDGKWRLSRVLSYNHIPHGN